MSDGLIESMEKLCLDHRLTRSSATKARKSQDSPHQCITCKKGFESTKGLRRHLRSCSSCKVSFKKLLKQRDEFVRRRMKLEEDEPIDWEKANADLCSRDPTFIQDEMSNLAAIARLERLFC
eukprot:c4029_g1_i1.p2 GENE.c4029_g1_i1~~c4029_g1_i1.p2  ORF type:complete len:122 (+),score=16.49 c4029_g1_i1:109-474(+)